MIIREGLVCEEYGIYVYLIGISHPGGHCTNLKELPKWRAVSTRDKSVKQIIDEWSDKLTMMHENGNTIDFEIWFKKSTTDPSKCYEYEPIDYIDYVKRCKEVIKSFEEEK